MILVNLLPWREQVREQRKKHFFAAGGGALGATLLGCVIAHFVINGWVEDQRSRNRYLTNEINKLKTINARIADIEKKKKALLTRLQVIESLQRERVVPVKLFDELLAVMPNGIYLTQLINKAKKIDLKGIATSNTNVSTLMRNIEKSKLLKKPVLSEIKVIEKDKREQREFNLVATIGKRKKLIINWK